MEPSQTFNPTLTAESFQMAYEENSPRDSAGSHPETLIRDLHNLTLNPPPRFPSPLPEGPAQVPDRSERKGSYRRPEVTLPIGREESDLVICKERTPGQDESSPEQQILPGSKRKAERWD
jgi:hypothetical protein